VGDLVQPLKEECSSLPLEEQPGLEPKRELHVAVRHSLQALGLLCVAVPLFLPRLALGQVVQQVCSGDALAFAVRSFVQVAAVLLLLAFWSVQGVTELCSLLRGLGSLDIT